MFKSSLAALIAYLADIDGLLGLNLKNHVPDNNVAIAIGVTVTMVVCYGLSHICRYLCKFNNTYKNTLPISKDLSKEYNGYSFEEVRLALRNKFVSSHGNLESLINRATGLNSERLLTLFETNHNKFDRGVSPISDDILELFLYEEVAPTLLLYDLVNKPFTNQYALTDKGRKFLTEYFIYKGKL